MNGKETIPELFVLGAGPGDPDLLTIKGYKVLQQANVVLYDNLANKELLDIAPGTADKIYVGKQPYGKYTPQEEILDMIKHFCFNKGKVVRLKGGDPFIFGRGFEEIIFARQLGIKTHFIPGITSMQACGLEDIPLTHRSISEGIWMLTGTKKDGSLSADLRLAMQSNATVVIYMGMKQLASIAETYIREGRGETAAAIIQHASLKHQKSASGLVKNLPAIAADNGLTYPAIIIIGNVVELKDIVNMEAYESAH
ncbi:uroporphyrinogen-III C-methyltransferase [Mucilaginibacter sp. L3T2-6]|uniref:uroporphyrinogen-III C-methyltransferase n=1 Tax=Mucilaginibacter sp. L3T2-6 TaxID=3062491 RepID=UPI002675EB73|nr:uroporphyrinogen-III C-methyltransferase [Mucilaginibacter sp. L3T2-6]MDO3641373.1 uroporphyrinogen-III C-methyltransferase [Mucilaginibacter sp. L3T2-6]MDV6213866.1 uroporphyrinogen-III C-methyltransferase [Mucilaginibacter sp. L3T2-6]